MPSEDIKEFAVTVRKVAPVYPSVSEPVKRIFLIDYAADILAGIKKPNIFGMLLLLSLYGVITVSVFIFGTIYPAVKNFEVRATRFVSDIFPDNLQITINNGSVSTNVTEPYYLTVDKGKLEDIAELFGVKRDGSISRIRVLTIDTKGRAEDFERYQTLALLTERSLVYYSDGEVKISSLSSVKDFTLTRKIILEKIQEINEDGKIVNIISWILIASPFILLLIFYLGSLLVLLNIAAIIHFFVSKTYFRSYGFSRTFRMVAFLYLCFYVIQVIFWLIPDYILVTQPFDRISMFLITIMAYIAVIRLRNRTPAPLKILFLPLVLIWDLFHSGRSTVARVFFAVGIILILGSSWVQAGQAGIEIVKYNLFQWGITNRITSVHVIGTSMLPTIRSGETVSLDSPRKYIPEKGDIVSFNNIETGAYSYIKRVIGTPGDVVSIRNGRVILNGMVISEPYTYKSFPTFGNTFLAECEPVTVPADSYLVLGDNRTVSMDSRVLGFVRWSDIDGVIKTGQIIDPDKNNQERSFDPGFDKNSFVKKLNEKREKEKHNKLIDSESVEKVALMRAKEIRDHYREWKMASRKLETLLDEEGYDYNMVHEYVTFGYLNEDDVINQIFESFPEKEIFMSDKYIEAGVGIAERSHNGCRYPIITVIITWPTKPTYDKAAIEYWQKQDEINIAILGKLNSLSGRLFDSQPGRSLIDRIAVLSEISSRVAGKMSRDEWLSAKDNADIRFYEQESVLIETSIRPLYSDEEIKDTLFQ